MKKNKYFLIWAFIIIFLFLGSSFAQALEITSYPTIPGYVTPSSSCTGNDCLSIYISYWFGVLIYIAGALAIISFAIGAVQLINPNIEAHNDAKDRMKGAVLGLILTTASFIIIQTINPTLITPVLTPLPGVQGIFYWNGSEEKPVGQEVIDTSSRPTGFNSLKYDCTGAATSSGTGPALLIWKFPNKGLEDGNGNLSAVQVVRKNCGDPPEDISSTGSFRMDFETLGVYYCLGGCSGNMCSGYMSNANLANQDNISDLFRGKIKGVRIMNGPVPEGPYYGVIFHKETGLKNGGECNLPSINSGAGGQCINVNNPDNTSAVDIFSLNKAPGASGDGVALYSEPFGQNMGSYAGFLNIPDSTITFPYYDDTADMLDFKYTNVNVSNEYKNKCVTFQDCPGSIKIKGSYLTALYSGYGCADNFDCDTGETCDLSTYTCIGGPNSSYCQTFANDVPNLNAQPMVASGAVYLDSIYIIPTK